MRFRAFIVALAILGLCMNSVSAQPAEPLDMAQVREDLAVIDARVSTGAYENGELVVGETIKARDIYRTYLKKAAELSEELVSVRQKLDLNKQTVSLQQLGAMSRNLTAENAHFKDTFRFGEDKFQTYQLIEKAVYNLEDAIKYWQMTNRFRWLYRGSSGERDEDDAILKIKLQTAVNAIDELKVILETRETLSRNLDENN
jgi:hypothetical protein